MKASETLRNEERACVSRGESYETRAAYYRNEVAQYEAFRDAEVEKALTHKKAAEALEALGL